MERQRQILSISRLNMKTTLVGYGEIGQSVHEVYKNHEIAIVDGKDDTLEGKECELLLIAFPYDNNFITYSLLYIKKLRPKVVVIFSTVKTGVTRELQQISGVECVHSPVVGIHPNLKEAMLLFPRYIGTRNSIAEVFLEQTVNGKITIRTFNDPETTENLKILSTTLYGLNIEYARFVKEILGDRYDDFKQWNLDYNKLYKDLGHPEYQKYILYPPEGEIKGHCVMPNAIILDEMKPNKFTNIILNK